MLAEGEGGVLLVAGPSGTGKTRMLVDALVVATTLGVATSRASAGDQHLVGPLAALAHNLGEPLGPQPPAPADSRSWVIDRLGAIVESHAAQAPLLLAVDDLQLADPETLDAIRTLVPQLDSYPLLWLLGGSLAVPATPVDRLFAALREAGAVQTELTALPTAAVAAVIEDVVGAQPDRQLLDFAEGAGGNPELVVELAEGLQDEGVIEVRGGVAHLASSTLPRRVHVIVADRLSRLSPDLRRMLVVAAALGRSFSVDELADVLDEPLARLLPTLQEAQDAGLLVPNGDGLAFRHELVRTVVYEGVAESIRLALHRQIGGVLLRRGGSAVAAARHMLQGARRGDREVLAALDGATRELLSSSPESAAELAVRALELTEQSDERRFSRILAAVDALIAGRRVGEAGDLARSTLATDQPGADAAARLRLTLSTLHFMAGRPEAALADADQVLAVPDLDEERHAGAELVQLMALMATGDVSEARRPAEAMLAGSGRSTSGSSLVGALTVMGSIAWSEVRVAYSIGLLRAAVRRSEQDPEATRRLHPRQSLAVVLGATGNFKEAEGLLRQDQREIERRGDSAWLAPVLIRQAFLHLTCGRVLDAEADAGTGLALAQELGCSLFLPLAVATQAMVAVLRGDIRLATERAAYVRTGLERKASVSAALATWVAARVAYGLHGPAEGVEVMSDAYANPGSYRRLFLEEPGCAPWLVRTALAAGDRQRAEAVATTAEILASANPDISPMVASANHARGLVNGDGAALDAAAVGHCHPWARASALEDSGVLLAAHDRDAASERFGSALGDYEHMGADGEAERIRGRLRRLGVLRRRGRRSAIGWESLTDTERRISRLIAESLTNAQAAERMFLSRHTVDFHLRQIFRKLNVRSRVELTRITVEQDRESS
jgi:DNA-binding CsgD family transcriptional regulator